MAINPNTARENKNTLYLACSGGGKSQALYQNKAIPRRGARVLLWDIDHDHQAVRLETLVEFHRAVIAGVKSGRGYRLAYSGADTPAAFEVFCRVVWASLNGEKETHIIIEELADAAPTTAKAGPEFGRLLRKGRKFGAVLHITSQRGAEIPKTAYTQCLTKYIGQQEAGDVDAMAKIAGVTSRDIRFLRPLSFFVKTAGPDAGKPLKLKYKKPR